MSLKIPDSRISATDIAVSYPRFDRRHAGVFRQPAAARKGFESRKQGQWARNCRRQAAAGHRPATMDWIKSRPSDSSWTMREAAWKLAKTFKADAKQYPLSRRMRIAPGGWPVPRCRSFFARKGPGMPTALESQCIACFDSNARRRGIANWCPPGRTLAGLVLCLPHQTGGNVQFARPLETGPLQFGGIRDAACAAR
ncbi:hypothetical protein AB4Z48_20490 [Cupriavidus sp. 2TAF22]|uniref:hypothetical protein n=1 Tax=unclassified Cupriavidus TaxID=2640874 RepID=UPI003F91E8C2